MPKTMFRTLRLSRRYLEANDNITGHFGDVDLTFEIRESL